MKFLKDYSTPLTLSILLFISPGQADDKQDDHLKDDNQYEVIIVTAPPESDGYKSNDISIAGKVALNPREIPNSVSVLTRQQMDDQDMVTITEAMKQVTGVNVIANDTLSNQYYVRGYGLGVMYDGVPSYNGMTPSHQFDLPAYESVEVLRGPAGLLSGSGEPGGVVNFVKKRPKGSNRASLSAGIGSWNNQRIEGDITGPLNESGTLRGRMVFADEDRDYFYDHTHSEKWLGLAAIEYDITAQTMFSLDFIEQVQDVQAPWSGLPALINLDDPDYGVYPLLDVSRSTFHVPDWGNMGYRTKETATGIEHRFDNGWMAKVRLNHREQRLEYKDIYTSTGVDPVTGLVNYYSYKGDDLYTRDGLDIYTNGPLQLFGRTHNLLLGFNSELYISKGKFGWGPEYVDIPFGDPASISEPDIDYTSGSEREISQHGLYSQLRLSVADPTTLVFGLRTTSFKVRSRDVSPSDESSWEDGAEADNEVTPYLAVIHDLNQQFTLYASSSDIFAPQTQMKANGDTLNPRTGRQYEIGTKGELMEGQLAVSFAIFNLRDKDRAYADPAYPNDNFYLNAGEIESRGWEVEASGRLSPGLDISAGYTNLTTRYLKDSYNEGKSYSISSPEHQLKIWGNYHFDQSSSLAGLSAGLGLRAQSKTQSTRGWRDQLLADGYTVVNARLAYQLEKSYEISLFVNNVFDTKYYETVGTPNIYNFYGEPRSFMLTLRANYD